MAQNDPTKMDFVLNMNVHEAHVWIAEDIDKTNLEAKLREPNKKRL